MAKNKKKEPRELEESLDPHANVEVNVQQVQAASSSEDKILYTVPATSFCVLKLKFYSFKKA